MHTPMSQEQHPEQVVRIVCYGKTIKIRLYAIILNMLASAILKDVSDLK